MDREIDILISWQRQSTVPKAWKFEMFLIYKPTSFLAKGAVDRSQLGACHQAPNVLTMSD